jgi:hypothetical protein
MSLTQVVAASSQGVLYDTVPVNKSTDVKFSGGSASKVSTTNLLTGVSTDRKDFGVFGSTVLDNNSSDPALSAGVFAYNNQSPIAKRITTSLSTVANDVLQSGAIVPSLIQSIHYTKVCDPSCNDGVRTRKTTSAIRNNKYDIFSGKFDTGFPEVVVDNFIGSDGSSGDTAAKPTRKSTGKLVFMSNAKVPVSSSYDDKNG